MAWLGIDLGTSSAKALLIDSRGAVLAAASATYRLSGTGGTVEQDPNVYIEAAKQLIASVRDAGRIRAVGLVGHTPTLVLVGADGSPLRPAITWGDTRASREARELAVQFGASAQLLGTALPWAPGHAAARLLWLARREPDTVRRTATILQPKDFLGLALTGSMTSDAWSSKGLCNVITGMPATELLEAIGWTAGVVPTIGLPWSARGSVLGSAARDYGLQEGIPVSVGWSDALSPILGLGGFLDQAAVISTGSSDLAAVVTRDVPLDAAPLYAVPATCAPMPVAYGPSQSSGTAVAWFSRLVGIEPAAAYDLAATKPIEALADAPVFLPYLAGERAPLWRETLRGAFQALSMDHDRAMLALSVIAGVACASRHILESAETVTGTHPEVTFLGGLVARNPTGRAIRAAVLGRSVSTRRQGHSSALGAAMLAAAACGVPLRQAVEQLMGPAEEHTPPRKAIRAGAVAYERYRRASDAAMEELEEQRMSPGDYPGR